MQSISAGVISESDAAFNNDMKYNLKPISSTGKEGKYKPKIEYDEQTKTLMATYKDFTLGKLDRLYATKCAGEQKHAFLFSIEIKLEDDFVVTICVRIALQTNLQRN